MPCALRYPIPLRKQIKKIKSRDNPGKHSTLQATGVCGGGGRRVAGARQDYERCDCGLIKIRECISSDVARLLHARVLD